jgi:hypothetical protein
MLKWTKYGNANEIERKRRESIGLEMQKYSKEINFSQEGRDFYKKIIKSYSLQNINEIKTVKEKGRRNAIKKFKNGKERKFIYFECFTHF